MTALGKILVFLILLLSLIWNFLVVNAYATRTNWKDRADKSQKEAVKAADSANSMKKLLDEERDAADVERRTLAEKAYAAEKQVEAYKVERTFTTQLYNQLAQDTQKEGVKIAALEANVKQLLQQVDTQRASQTALEKQNDDLIREANQANIAADRARLDARIQKARGDQLAERIEELQRENERLRASGGGTLTATIPGLDGPVPTAPGFRGEVQKLDPPTTAGEPYLVTFTPGANAGVRPGQVVTVSRSGQLIGRLTVLLTNATESVGRFEPPPGRRLEAKDYPKPKDLLTPGLR